VANLYIVDMTHGTNMEAEEVHRNHSSEIGWFKQFSSWLLGLTCRLVCYAGICNPKLKCHKLSCSPNDGDCIIGLEFVQKSIDTNLLIDQNSARACRLPMHKTLR